MNDAPTAPTTGGLAGEPGAVSEPRYRLDAGAMGSDEVNQPEALELARGPVHLGVVGLKESEFGLVMLNEVRRDLGIDRSGILYRGTRQ